MDLAALTVYTVLEVAARARFEITADVLDRQQCWEDSRKCVGPLWERWRDRCSEPSGYSHNRPYLRFRQTTISRRVGMFPVQIPPSHSRKSLVEVTILPKGELPRLLTGRYLAQVRGRPLLNSCL